MSENTSGPLNYSFLLEIAINVTIRRQVGVLSKSTRDLSPHLELIFSKGPTLSTQQPNSQKEGLVPPLTLPLCTLSAPLSPFDLILILVCFSALAQLSLPL
jgi:hypothetical protein